MKRALPQSIELLLERLIGLDSRSLPHGLLLRAVKRRMVALGLDSIASYEEVISISSDEQQELIEEVVVPETWFLRDERPFDWLGTLVARMRATNTLPQPLRVLSLACSSGEEPYSIAIVLLEAGLTKDQFAIDAVDTSARRLAAARAGVYSSNAFRGAGSKLIPRWFHTHPQGYEIDLELRKLVRFRQASLLAPHLLAECAPYHIIFCRNVLIYLTETTRNHVELLLERKLAQDGWLVLGHADRLGSSGQSPRFVPSGDSACFTYRRASEVATPPVPLADPARMPPALATPVQAAAHSRQKPAPRLPGTRLDQAEQLLNLGKKSEALALCEREIQERGPSSRAYHLMGVVHLGQGDRKRAEECFLKTVYLDPRHELALLSLAVLAEQRGDATAAARLRRRAKGRTGHEAAS